MRANLRICCVAISIFFVLLGNPANLAAIDFAAAKSYPAGTSPEAVAVGDFNGDGKVDIAVANTGGRNMSILLGNGDGTFQPAVNFSAGNGPTAIAVGDFNDDGKLDLALFQAGAGGIAGSVSILLGNGDGTFQTPKNMALSQNASFIAVADFNGDKKSDLAIGDPGSLSIFIGNGDGTFQTAKQTTLTSNCAGFITADFNGDLKPDVAVVTTAGIQILLGKGDGTFSQGATVIVASVAPPNPVIYESVVAADLNHDGKEDVLVSARVIEGCGGRPPCHVEATTVSAFLGNGDGSFQGEQVAARQSLSMTAGDIPRGYEIENPIVGDFNGDGRLDLAYRKTAAVRSLVPVLEFRLGKGDGTFSSPVLSVVESVSVKPIAQDLNGDKLTDLIAVGTANDIHVRLNTSSASGADLGILSSGSSPLLVGVGTNLKFTADLLDLGPHDATGVTFTDTLPNGTSFVSATATQGNCLQSHGVVSCSIGSLASAFDANVSIVVTPTVVGIITNSMNVKASEPDLVPANNDATQTANVLPVFTLTVTRSGSGTGTMTVPNDLNGPVDCASGCTATYLSGTVVNVSENPDATSVFAGWGGSCTGTSACAVTMNADESVTANFILGVKLSVSLAGSGSGSVASKDSAINCASSGANCSSLYLPGTSVSLTAVPAGTSVFGGWSGGCTGMDPNVCSLTMNSVQSVTATFNPPSDFTLSPASMTFTTQPGARVTDTLMLTGQNGFSGQVNLNCVVTGPAPLATCGVSPSSVSVGSSSGNSTLTITAPATLGAFAIPLKEGGRITAYAMVLPVPALLLGGIGLVSQRFRKRASSFWFLGGGVIIVFAALAGCGGGGTTQRTPTNYMVTVNATSVTGSLQHSTTVTLTVQ